MELITGSIFHKNSESLKLIINYCIANNISLGKSLFACKFEELDRLLKTCQKEGIDFKGIVSRTNQETLDRIIDICNEYEIELIKTIKDYGSRLRKNLVK